MPEFRKVVLNFDGSDVLLGSAFFEFLILTAHSSSVFVVSNRLVDLSRLTGGTSTVSGRVIGGDLETFLSGRTEG